MQNEDFIKLPDWKKMELVQKNKAFHRFAFMTLEQRAHRFQVMHDISLHFNTEAAINEEESLGQSMTWPSKMGMFITPRILDHIDKDFICQFSYCYFCSHFKTEKPIMAVVTENQILKSPVPIIYGMCDLMPVNGNTNLSINPNVRYNHRCPDWNPQRLYINLLYHKVKAKIEKTGYTWDDYQKDLLHVNAWIFLSNAF